jgi:hypothetical protein
LTLSWYVVVSVGKTSRDPLVETAPIPWFSSAPVALLELHFNVADLPRSMEVGSAVKFAVGRAGGAGFTSGVGGGGGAGGGTFFLHPAANSAKLKPNKIKAIFRF